MKNGSNQNWDSYYSENRDFSLMTSQALTKVLAHVDARLEKICLDLGCGTGQLTRELFHRGYTCVGVDLAESALRTAKSLTVQASSLTYIRGDLETLQSTDLPRRQFSLITCKLVIAFVKDKERFLKLAHDSLAPGGTFAVVTPVFGSKICEKKPGICVSSEEIEKQLGDRFGNVTVEPLGDVECFISHRQS
ncbi:class I SAM-dependent methyltransferase [Streptomyces sp. bgisy034]|uniref:class I SAM-dependent methyltransferase n=1 Tax=Streptomyces sp. bgisy034 TaxID=3413774 RepID=UPI003EB77511